MIRCLTLTTAMLFLFMADAYTQRRLPVIPAHAIPPGTSAAQVQKKLQHMMQAAHGTTGAMLKATAGSERLLAEATYNHISTPAPADSIVFVYSRGRSSEFDFGNLCYDFEEANTDFYPVQFGNYGYVDYDSLNYYDSSGSSSYETPGIRSYNAAGKVTKAVQATHMILFSYDAAGRLATSMEGAYDAATNTYDSSYRSFYFYNTAGHLIKDSTESWHPFGPSWKPDGTYYHTLNAAGYPTKSELVYFAGLPRIVMFESNCAYNGMNQLTNTLLKGYDGGSLKNYYRDTIGYAGAMQQYSDSYRWDTAMNAWVLSWQERRRMNASGLPDSVWTWYNYSGPSDTTIYKLAYNAQGNPVNRWDFFGNSRVAQVGYRWYYEAINNVSVNHMPVRADLLAYPNPAGGMLYLTGVKEGRYSIQNMAGQMLQSGTLNPAGVPVGMLAPGIYSISLLDKAGVLHTARFVRQ